MFCRVPVAAACLLAWWLFLAPAAHAVDPGARIADLHHDTWGAKEGAPPTMMALAQTPDGWIWIGTYQGLYRFDGLRFERFAPPPGESLTYNTISTLSTAPNGDLVIGYLVGGMSVLHQGHLRHLTSVARQPFSNTFVVTADIDGTYWAGALDGFLHFDGKSWERIGAAWGYPATRTDNIMVDRYGRLFVSDSRDIYMLDRAHKQFIRTGVASAANNADMVFDSHDKLWIGADDAMTPVPPPPPGMPVQPAVDVRAGPALERMFDRDGNLWLRRHDTRICMVPQALVPANGAFSTSQPGFDGNCTEKRKDLSAMSMMMEDRDGNIWIVMPKGLERYRENRLRTIPYPAPTTRASIVRDANGAVTLTAGDHPTSRYRLDDTGTHPLDDGTGPVVLQRPGIGATLLLAAPDALIVQQPDGTRRIPYPVPAPAPKDRIGRLIQEGADAFWVGWSLHGLWRYAGGQWTRVPHYGKPVTRSGAAADGRGQVWLGYANNTVVAVGPQGPRHFNAVDGVDVRVATFIDVQREVLIAGDGGLQVLAGTRFRHLRAADPNALAGISGMVIAPNGDRWFNTSSGVLHVRASDWIAAMQAPEALLRYELLDQQDGFPGGPQYSNVATAAVAPDGRLWFAASGAVAVYDPRPDRPAPGAPPPVILAMAAGGQRYDPARPVRIPPGSDHIDLSYTALNYTFPERTVFRYRLDGVDTAWQGPVVNRDVSFANLAPGQYTFALQAGMRGGAWSERTAYARFTIAPRFTQTWWFYCLCALGLLMLTVLAHRLRVRSITRRLREQSAARQLERERIARELHDTVLQTNFALLLQVRAVAASAENDTVGARLAAIVSQAQASLAVGRDKVAGLRARQDAAPLFPVALEQVASDQLDGSAVALTVASHGAPWPLTEAVASECLAIVAEAVANVRKHAQAHAVRIDVHYGWRACTVVIADDGRGIPAEFLDGRIGHWGLIGMRERAGLIKARLDISSSDAGTTLRLRVPRWRVGRLAS